jgi:hypothetical protein
VEQVVDMRIVCWEGEHLPTVLLAVPVGLAVGIGFPALIVMRARSYFSDTGVGASERQLTQSGDFVLTSKGLAHWDAVFRIVKSEAFWWPVFMMILKVAINILFVWGRSRDSQTWGLWMQMLLIFSALIAFQTSPYRWEKDNSGEESFSMVYAHLSL